VLPPGHLIIKPVDAGDRARSVRNQQDGNVVPRAALLSSAEGVQLCEIVPAGGGATSSGSSVAEARYEVSGRSDDKQIPSPMPEQVLESMRRAASSPLYPNGVVAGAGHHDVSRTGDENGATLFGTQFSFWRTTESPSLYVVEDSSSAGTPAGATNELQIAARALHEFLAAQRQPATT
jgi:hypothetical protein